MLLREVEKQSAEINNDYALKFDTKFEASTGSVTFVVENTSDLPGILQACKNVQLSFQNQGLKDSTLVYLGREIPLSPNSDVDSVINGFYSGLVSIEDGAPYYNRRGTPDVRDAFILETLQKISGKGIRVRLENGQQIEFDGKLGVADFLKAASNLAEVSTDVHELSAGEFNGSYRPVKPGRVPIELTPRSRKDLLNRIGSEIKSASLEQVNVKLWDDSDDDGLPDTIYHDASYKSGDIELLVRVESPFEYKVINDWDVLLKVGGEKVQISTQEAGSLYEQIRERYEFLNLEYRKRNNH